MSDVVLYSGRLFVLADALSRAQPKRAPKYSRTHCSNNWAISTNGSVKPNILPASIQSPISRLYPAVNQRRELYEEADGLPNLDRWRQMMAARPGIAKGMQLVA